MATKNVSRSKISATTTCPTCEKSIPQEVLAANRGECINCAVYSYCHGRKWRKEKDCIWCGGILVPIRAKPDRPAGRIGTSRMNGKNHNDWNERDMHKKCYIQWRKSNE